METKIVQLQNMESLDRLLKAKFSKVKEVVYFPDLQRFEIYLDGSCRAAAPVIKALNKYLGPFVAEHGEVEQAYYFEIHRENELLDVLRYNDPGSEFYINIEMNDNLHTLRILDVLGATNDFTVFDEDFERLGSFYAEGAAEFKPGDHWHTDDEQLTPYLDEIVTKIGEQENDHIEMEINIDDPAELSFWAEQFAISETELRKAVFAAGKSVLALTSYLQR